MFKRITISILFSAFIFNASKNYAQTQTLGLFLNDTLNTFKGYTVFAPKHNSMTYLIDNEGRKVHEWSASTLPPGQTVYLLENGDLLRSCMVHGQLSSGGGEGGRIEEYNWNDSLVWSFDYSTATYTQHHDIKRLPNGNIIMCVIEVKTIADVVTAGFDTSKIQEPDFRNKRMLLPDAVVEIKPTYPSGGTVVWQWHVWDHLIQSHDATKSNYGVPSAHPELIDAAGNHLMLPVFWNHFNCIDYDSTLDQIALSCRGNSEVWIIDHSTTTTQAASHTGGNRGKGGDLLYRWGNPICYGAGTSANDKYLQQHDVEWIKTGCPGAGDLMCFNNGIGRNYSSIDEITTPVDLLGNYSLTAGQAYAPTSLTWTYQATPPTSLYAEDISGAQRLPNGNTLINDGPNGTLTEVTSTGTTVWKYICPADSAGPMMQGTAVPPDPTHLGEYMNAVFRVYRYPLNYPAFTGRNMTPGTFIELYPATSVNTINQSSLIQIYPNPFTSNINIKNAKGNEQYELIDNIGQTIWSGKQINQQDFSSLSTGIYMLKITGLTTVQTIKLIKQNK